MGARKGEGKREERKGKRKRRENAKSFSGRNKEGNGWKPVLKAEMLRNDLTVGSVLSLTLKNT